VWSLGATVYSLLAGRSPFEVLGGDKNGASDLIGRIDKAKLVPTGRTDVPPTLERLLARSMSRRPENRQASVLEFVRELQQVESEIGVVQTPIEVAVDDWALATVADLEDKTRLRGVTPVQASRRRRRRRATEAQVQAQHGGSLQQSRAVPRSTGTRPVRRRSVLVMTWALVAVSVVGIGLAAAATLVLVRSTSTDIPRVADVASSSDGSSVVFTWSDPGLRAGDTYVISTGGQTSQQSADRFVATPADPGDEVCITVTVSRGGSTGPASNENCATAGQG
jgi:hypothetical protein